MNSLTYHLQIICIVLLCFLATGSKAQETSDNQLLLKDAENFVFSNPDYGIKISEFVISSNPDSKTKFKANYLLATSYYIKGKYKEALEYIIFAKRSSESLELQSEFIASSLLLAEILNQLQFFDLSNQYLNDASNIAKTLNLQSKDLKWIDSKTLQNQAHLDFLNHKSKLGHANLLKSSSLQQDTVKSQFQLNLNPVSLDLIDYQINHLDLDNAQNDIETLLESTSLQKNDYLKMLVLYRHGKLAYLKGRYKSAIESLNQAFNISNTLDNIQLKYSINNALIANYIALQDENGFLKHNKQSTYLLNQSNDLKKNSINNVLSFIEDQGTAKNAQLKSSYSKNNVLLLALLSVILLYGLSLKYIRKKQIKQYRDILKYFESSKLKNISLTEPVNSNITETPKESKEGVSEHSLVKPIEQKGVQILKETENTIISKLDRFEKSNEFTSQDVSLGQLASKLETNTKYLSEIINKVKGKNFNAYINELRINYIIDKLKEDPKFLSYKVSYLAEFCGFSSHSSFATVFKSVTGLSPTVFINIIKKEQKEL